MRCNNQPSHRFDIFLIQDKKGVTTDDEMMSRVYLRSPLLLCRRILRHSFLFYPNSPVFLCLFGILGIIILRLVSFSLPSLTSVSVCIIQFADWKKNASTICTSSVLLANLAGLFGSGSKTLDFFALVTVGKQFHTSARRLVATLLFLRWDSTSDIFPVYLAQRSGLLLSCCSSNEVLIPPANIALSSMFHLWENTVVLWKV